MVEKGYRMQAFCCVRCGKQLECVELFLYSATKNKFKIVWPYMRYDDKVGDKHDGMHSDL